jgi:hypothetical protein
MLTWQDAGVRFYHHCYFLTAIRAMSTRNPFGVERLKILMALNNLQTKFAEIEDNDRDRYS